MGGVSLLFPYYTPQFAKDEPEFFNDLNLDIVVERIVKSAKEEELRPYFYTLPEDQRTIVYRQKVLMDIEQEPVFDRLSKFLANMERVSEYMKIASGSGHRHFRNRYLLDAANIYTESIKALKESLEEAPLQSEGMRKLEAYLRQYTQSASFLQLNRDVSETLGAMHSVEYTVYIKENKVRVDRFRDQEDYTKEISVAFERFGKDDMDDDLQLQVTHTTFMNHIEQKILDLLARLFPEQFGMLDRFCLTHGDFFPNEIKKLILEMRFYVSYLRFILPLERMGLSFCYPAFEDKNNIYANEIFDIALADRLRETGRRVVPNDFYMKNDERIFVITGPNQGGKTTFAKAFGQLFYLFKLGVKTPGRRAGLFLFDTIYTHFETEESAENLRGKLADELIRMKSILQRITPSSIVIMNESFASTSLDDALELSKNILKKMLDKDCVVVYVTFMYELIHFDSRIVSLMSTVSQRDVSKRTFKIVRREADGASFAMSIAMKYGLTYERLKERIGDG